MCAVVVAGSSQIAEGARVPGRRRWPNAAPPSGSTRACARIASSRIDAACRPAAPPSSPTIAADDRLVERPQEVALPVVAQAERQAAAHRPGGRDTPSAPTVSEIAGRACPKRSQDVGSDVDVARPADADADRQGTGERPRRAGRSAPSARARRAPSRPSTRELAEDLLDRADRVVDVAREDRPGSSGLGTRTPSRRRSCRRRRAAPRAAPDRRPGRPRPARRPR